MSVAAELGDAGEALRTATTVDLERLLAGLLPGIEILRHQELAGLAVACSWKWPAVGIPHSVCGPGSKPSQHRVILVLLAALLVAGAVGFLYRGHRRRHRHRFSQ